MNARCSLLAPNRVTMFVLAAAAVAAVVGGCGGSSDTASPAEVLADGGSVAHVTIGSAGYDFVVDCYDAGAGSVVVVGEGALPGADEGDARDTHLFVQAFLSDSYVGVTVAPNGDEPEELYEASLDDALDLALDGDVIEAEAFTFVRNLDLDNGAGAEVGDGTLRVTCGRYEGGTPPGQGP